ncbi:hypothetical protein SEVIR_9G124401v4 [Setaria viridis]
MREHGSFLWLRLLPPPTGIVAAALLAYHPVDRPPDAARRRAAAVPGVVEVRHEAHEDGRQHVEAAVGLVHLLDAAVLAEPDGAAADLLRAEEVVVPRVSEHPDAVRPAPVGAAVGAEHLEDLVAVHGGEREVGLGAAADAGERRPHGPAVVVLPEAVAPELHVAVGQVHLVADLLLVAHHDEAARPAGDVGRGEVAAPEVEEGAERDRGDDRRGECGELDGHRGHGDAAAVARGRGSGSSRGSSGTCLVEAGMQNGGALVVADACFETALAEVCRGGQT